MIVLATCSRLPALSPDDGVLHRAMLARDVQTRVVVWDDASFDWGAARLCVIRSTWDYQLRRDAYVQWAEHVGSVTRLCNPARVVAWNADKTYLRNLEARGVPVVPTRWLERGQRADVDELLVDEALGGAIVIKPVVAAGGRDTIRVTRANVDEGREHLRRTLSREAMMVQPLLSSVEREGEVSLMYIDGVFTHAVRKLPRAGEFRVQDDHGGSVELCEADAAARALGAAAVRAIEGELLYARVDVIRDDAGMWRVVELELVEPEMFLRFSREATEQFVEGILTRARGKGVRQAR